MLWFSDSPFGSARMAFVNGIFCSPLWVPLWLACKMDLSISLFLPRLAGFNYPMVVAAYIAGTVVVSLSAVCKAIIDVSLLECRFYTPFLPDVCVSRSSFNGSEPNSVDLFKLVLAGCR